MDAHSLPFKNFLAAIRSLDIHIHHRTYSPSPEHNLINARTVSINGSVHWGENESVCKEYKTELKSITEKVHNYIRDKREENTHENFQIYINDCINELDYMRLKFSKINNDNITSISRKDFTIDTINTIPDYTISDEIIKKDEEYISQSVLFYQFNCIEDTLKFLRLKLAPLSKDANATNDNPEIEIDQSQMNYLAAELTRYQSKINY